MSPETIVVIGQRALEIMLLLSLLHLRWQALPQAPLTILPCELVERNGEFGTSQKHMRPAVYTVDEFQAPLPLRPCAPAPRLARISKQ